ncbi:aldose epimerase family protein [Olivibacter sitiensis]|uniref:aldose epimerase family protein n=1 Tax=Olivibacter sitiensis TaxID=376470 RepID=UPI00040D018B|nr:aldose epimerase family protein [Olivibacter sitiensis]
MMNLGKLTAGLLVVGVAACGSPAGKQGSAELDKADSVDFKLGNFNQEHEGKQIGIYYLKNKDGVSAAITNFGARLVQLLVPDKNGQLTDVVLGHDNINEYLKNPTTFYGSTIGRYGNRIKDGAFSLDGQTYQLQQNDGSNSLHGGKDGFHTKVFDAQQVDSQTVKLTYISVDGEAGYPGTLTATITYRLTDNNSIEISYEATSDKNTVANLTNHSFFNLNGAGNGDILSHELQIDADAITSVDSTLIPTGELMPVEGTAFDFKNATKVGERIGNEEEQLKLGGGYDHNYVLNKKEGYGKIASLYSAETGIFMEVYTDQPGVQFYSGNFMKGGDHHGKGGKDYDYRTALCLETQHFPDSPNRPEFPSTVLKAGEKYRTKTSYHFTVK